MTELIQQGSPDGLFYLGVMYDQGKGLAQDKTKAFQLYSEAAQKDHISAQYNLGIQYATGEGVTQDFSKAEYWWTKAAERGLMQAQFNLGNLYYYGMTGKKNPATARKWLTLAAKQGSPPAKEILAQLDAEEAQTPSLSPQFIGPDTTPRTSTDTLRPEAKPAAKPPAVTRPAAAPAKAENKEYGPVKRDDTLFKIATSVKPEGVTLEQMLVSLYHANPDAFGGNMNHLKTGKILRVPEKEHVIETGQSEAVKEMRVEAENWNAYRRTLAETVGETTARESRSAASGRITAAVDDKAAAKETPKEVLKLSKGEPTAPGKAGNGKGARTNAERMRMLEEETTAREKALAEVNDRIARLEKTIQDMQRLLEIKGQVPGAPAGKPMLQPTPETKPGATPPVKGDQVAKMEPAKAEPAKAEPAERPATAPPQGEAPKIETPKAEPDAQVQPKPKPKPIEIVQAPPDLIDQILEEPLYLAVGGGLIALLGAAGYWFARRRRTQVNE
jgi:pilus assembly protein FimV